MAFIPEAINLKLEVIQDGIYSRIVLISGTCTYPRVPLALFQNFLNLELVLIQECLWHYFRISLILNL
ncbi:MAG: hypothetical protein ACE5KT_06975, partial [Methanosarcinales archaeon]